MTSIVLSSGRKWTIHLKHVSDIAEGFDAIMIDYHLKVSSWCVKISKCPSVKVKFKLCTLMIYLSVNVTPWVLRQFIHGRQWPRLVRYAQLLVCEFSDTACRENRVKAICNTYVVILLYQIKDDFMQNIEYSEYWNSKSLASRRPTFMYIVRLCFVLYIIVYVKCTAHTIAHCMLYILNLQLHVLFTVYHIIVHCKCVVNMESSKLYNKFRLYLF